MGPGGLLGMPALLPGTLPLPALPVIPQSPLAGPMGQPWGSPALVPASLPSIAKPSHHPTPMAGFVAKVEEGPKGERIYRYSLGPGADVDGCFRNVRRRIEVELEDGLTVQM